MGEDGDAIAASFLWMNKFMPFRISQPSCQSLYVELRFNEMKISSATAFIATSSRGKHFLITNRHCVTGRDNETDALLDEKHASVPDTIVVWHNSSRALGEFVPIEIPLYDGGKHAWIEHPSLESGADLVAIFIPDRPEIAMYPYAASHFDLWDIEPSSTVHVVGFPFGERTGKSFAIWATGTVASEPEIDHGGKPIFLIDCRSRPGQSGSPVILYQNGGGVITHDDGSKVISGTTSLLGIYAGRINTQSDLGRVWKARIISELLVYADAISH